MIRILQQNNKAMKVVFGVIIGFAVVTMVITLVPGIFDNVGSSGDPQTYATVHEPGFFGRIFGSSETVTRDEIGRVIQQQTQGRPVPPYILPYFESQAGTQLVQLAILKLEGDRRGLQVSDADLARFLHQGQIGQVLFPNGNYIGKDKYMDFVQAQLNMTVDQFEAAVKKDIEQGRLQSLITGGVTVADNDVRDPYRVSGTKVKFDYAVVTSEDIAKTIAPSDADLQTFFKSNAPRYATAIAETRKLQYLSFGVDQLPGGAPKVSDAEIQAYYEGHLKNYTTEETARARHILIAVPAGASPQVDAAAKAKAEDLLKQIKGGADFAKLAQANSDDPGSKSTGGELGTFGRGKMVPEFEKAVFSLQPGQTSDPVKTSFGYHLIQTEARTPASVKSLADVKPEILPVLQQQKVGAAEQAYANQLLAEAKKDGIDKTAAAHNLHALTTDYLAKDGTVAGVSDGTAMLGSAFTTNKGAPPAVASTGDGFAVFQVLDVKAPHAPTFDEWRSHVLTDYRDQKVPELLNQQLTKLAALAKQTGDLHQAAAQLNIPVKSSELVGKDGQVPDLGAMTGSANVAFSLPKGGISGALNNGGNGAVLQVVDKQEPTTDEIAKNFNDTREKMLNTKKSEVFNIYLGTLADKYKKAGLIHSKAPTTPSPLGT